MSDIDFMCEVCHIDEILAQMTPEERMLLVLPLIKDYRESKQKKKVSRNGMVASLNHRHDCRSDY